MRLDERDAELGVRQGDRGGCADDTAAYDDHIEDGRARVRMIGWCSFHNVVFRPSSHQDTLRHCLWQIGPFFFKISVLPTAHLTMGEPLF